MKRILIVALTALVLTGCYKDEIFEPVVEIKKELQIQNAVGLKLESAFVPVRTWTVKLILCDMWRCKC